MPAYLDPNLNVEDLKTGVSFASGASGYDVLTSIVAVTSYSVQLSTCKIIVLPIYFLIYYC